jgi:hypothetical protein
MSNINYELLEKLRRVSFELLLRLEQLRQECYTLEKVSENDLDYERASKTMDAIVQITTPIFDMIVEKKEEDAKFRCRNRILRGTSTEDDVFACQDAYNLFKSLECFEELPIGELLYTGYGKGGKMTLSDVRDLLQQEEIDKI